MARPRGKTVSIFTGVALLGCALAYVAVSVLPANRLLPAACCAVLLTTYWVVRGEEGGGD